MEYIELEMSDQDSAMIARAARSLGEKVEDYAKRVLTTESKQTRVLACKCGCDPKGGHEPWYTDKA